MVLVDGHFARSCVFKSAAQQSPTPPPDPPQAVADKGQSADRSTVSQPQLTPPVARPANQPFASPGAGKANGNQSSPRPSGAASKDRLFFTLPNSLTVEDAGHVKPLTAQEKFNLTARSSFDWGQYLWCVALSGAELEVGFGGQPSGK